MYRGKVHVCICMSKELVYMCMYRKAFDETTTLRKLCALKICHATVYKCNVYKYTFQQ